MSHYEYANGVNEQVEWSGMLRRLHCQDITASSDGLFNEDLTAMDSLLY